MARKRLVSPRFFKHAALYKAEVASGLPLRLAYQALWCQCDRRGVFRWEPEELKLDCLPYDAVDFELVMWTLVQHGFLTCYEVNGKRYGFVPTFTDHQTFHRDEKPDKTIPDTTQGVVVAYFAPLSTASRAEQKCEHGASTVPARCEHGASTPITITDTIAVTNTTGAAPTRRAPKGAPKAFPHFGAEDRARALAAFKRLGEFPAGRVINAIGPCYRPPSDPEHIPHGFVGLGVEDYVGLVTMGRSAPFASPEDCAKKLIALARNCQRFEDACDPVGRHDANTVVIHGVRTRAAA
jgi:hypothetical protein